MDLEHHDASLTITQEPEVVCVHLCFPFLKSDYVGRRFDSVVPPDGLAKLLPLNPARSHVRAMQTLIRAGYLLGNGSMYVDSETLAESPYAGAVVTR